MHAAIHLLSLWGLAFLSLGIAVVLLNIYSGLIGTDLEMHGVGKEAAIAVAASLIEATGFWLILSFVPTATRAMIIPALIVALIYKIAHLENWSRYDIFILLAFQITIAYVGGALIHGHFQAALITAVVFVVFLAVIAGFLRSL